MSADAALFSEEFVQHGISDYVILQHRNVCKDGFDMQDEVDCGTF